MESAVCKLNKPLYGLKQAPRCWNQRFIRFLSQYNFKCSEADQCIYIGQVNSETVYLALFVDDGLVAAETQKTLDIIAGHLSKEFKIKIGDSSSFAGMRIERDRNKKTLSICQRAHTEKIIEKFGMRDAKKVSVPVDPHVVLYPVREGEEKSGTVPYREAVGSLVFLAAVSRPDIAAEHSQ